MPTYTLGEVVTLSVLDTVNGVATDPTTISLQVLDPDRTLTTYAPTHTEVGTFEQVIVPMKPGTWRYEWRTSGEAQAVVDGSFEIRPSELDEPTYFDLDELRALPNVSDRTKYPDVALAAARDWITAIVERVCGTSFVARRKVETIEYGDLLPDRYTLSLISVLDSAGVDSTLDAGLTAAGRLTIATFFSPRAYATRPRLTVTYLAGFSFSPPADLKHVMLQAARYRLVSVDGASGIPNRALTMANEFGNITLASASVDRPTGIPDVDAVIMGWARRVGMSSVA